MELSKRIRRRREELGMSQAELAKKLGYKSRSTIAKIEAGENDIVQSKIVAFADALETTPSYLMGWMDADDLIRLSVEEVRERLEKEKAEFLELFQKRDAPKLNADGSIIMRVLMEFFLFKLEQGADISGDINYMNEYLQGYQDEKGK